MSIVVNCGECGQSARVRDEMAGRSIRCRACGESIPVPGEDDAGDDYAVRSPGRSPRAYTARRRRSDGGGLGLVGKILSVCAAIAVGVTAVMAKLMLRAGARWGLGGNQNAAAPEPQPNVAARPKINLPANSAPALPNPSSFPQPYLPQEPFQPPTTNSPMHSPAGFPPAFNPPGHAPPNTTPAGPPIPTGPPGFGPRRGPGRALMPAQIAH